MALTSGRLATEEAAADPGAPGGSRVSSEKAVLSLATHGIRASLVCLPPCVHDERKAGLAIRMVDIASKKGFSAYIDDGENRWPAVHRLDATRLFRMAVEGEGSMVRTTGPTLRMSRSGRQKLLEPGRI